MTSIRGTLATVLASFLLVLAIPQAADAHGLSSTYVTDVTGIKPNLDGVTATAPSDGSSIKVTNTTDTPLLVMGYQGEPYVKITRDGVWENQNSPAVYLNKEYSIQNIPKTANANATPDWKKLTSGNSFQWHDHRIHWMGESVPPAVQQDPHHEHLVDSWSIPLQFGDRTATINGTLTYQPGSRWANYLVYGSLGLVVIAVIAIAFAAGRKQRAQAPAPHEPSEPAEPAPSQPS